MGSERWTKRNLLVGAFASMGLLACGNGSAAIEADYTKAVTAAGDEDVIADFNIYDLAVGATLIEPHAGNIGSLAGGTFVVGDTFTGYFQTYLTNHQLNGVVQAAPGLNTAGTGAGYELTVAATFTESVTAIDTFGNPTMAITGGSAHIYFDTTPDYSFGTDSGFTNDEILLGGSITGGGGSIILALMAGFAQIDVAITSGNIAVYDPDIANAQGVFALDLRSSAFAGVTHVLTHAVDPGDKLFGADGNLQLTSVPVPAAAWLFGSALLGLVGGAKAKRRSTQATG